VLVLALVAALAGAGPLGPGAVAALLVAVGAPALAAGALLPAAVALTVGALAGAIGGPLAGPGAVDALAARVIRLLEAAEAAGGRSARWSPSSLPHLHSTPLPVGLRVGEGGVGLELGQQRPAIASTHACGLGQPSTGHGLAGGDQGGIGLAGTLALALAGGGLLVLDLGGRAGGGRGAVEQAEHSEGADQPHRVAPAVR
jgi:hypothetical protein